MKVLDCALDEDERRSSHEKERRSIGGRMVGLAAAGDRADNRVPELESELAVRPLLVLAWLLRVQLVEDPHGQAPVLVAEAEQDVLVTHSSA